MNDEDLLRLELQQDLQTLTAAAPPPRQFPLLWREVQSRREAQFERRLTLTMAIPTAGLFLVGVASASMGGWHTAIPCCAVALWLASQLGGGDRDFSATI